MGVVFITFKSTKGYPLTILGKVIKIVNNMDKLGISMVDFFLDQLRGN